MTARSNLVYLNRRIIGPYEYYQHKVLGRGTNSIAFEGRKISSGQKICIKQISIKSPTIHKMVQTEIDILKQISHLNVVKYISHFERGSSIFIVTELCEMNLETKIKKQAQFCQQNALVMFLQILQGYQKLRNIGYIHRDIKPENLLVSENTIKLADFGYSTLMRGNSIQQRFNIGSPMYMAPESILHNVYSEKSDVWSLGITFHELLFGKTPFSSKSQSQLKRQMKKPIKFGNGHPTLVKILKNCLEYHPEDRIDLLRLILDVKLALNEINGVREQDIEVERKISIREIQINELSFIKFLEYVKLLLVKSKDLLKQNGERAIYLLEYNIRMRLHFLEQLFSKSIDGNQGRERVEYLRLKLIHIDPLQFPQLINGSDNLNFFKDSPIIFKPSLQWQTQGVLKELIKNVYSEVGNVKSEYEVALKEQKIKIVDFLLTAFILNRMLIEKENNVVEFALQSQLKLILGSPTRINLSTLEKIKKKLLDIGII